MLLIDYFLKEIRMKTGFGFIPLTSFSEKKKYVHIQGGGVPGGHWVICGKGSSRKPFITPMRECFSIPLQHSDIVVDIGAYIGTYAIRCGRFPVKRVDAYEPTLETFQILSKTHLPNMKLINAAIVGDDRKNIDLFISEGIGVTNSTILSHRKKAPVSVVAINYTKAVSNASIVKIDVEGAEYTFPIVQPTLRAIIIDFHPIPGHHWQADADALIVQMKSAGFESVITPNYNNGWTRAGSWIRPMKNEGEFHPMMSGKICCGCGIPVRGKRKSLCPDCYQTWMPKHRNDFTLANIEKTIYD